VWVGFLIFEESTPASWDARRRSHFRLYLQGSMISNRSDIVISDTPITRCKIWTETLR
jgi:hypothetical protein